MAQPCRLPFPSPLTVKGPQSHEKVETLNGVYLLYIRFPTKTGKTLASGRENQMKDAV
jgi:hypothetical protein